MVNKIFGLLGLARKAGMIVIGDPILDDVRRGRVAALLLASDAADNTRRRAENWSLGGRIPITRLPYDKETLGLTLGRTTCALAALTDQGIYNELVRLLGGGTKEDTE